MPEAVLGNSVCFSVLRKQKRIPHLLGKWGDLQHSAAGVPPCVLCYYGAFHSKQSQHLVYAQQPKIRSVQQNALNIRRVLSQENRLLKEFFTGSYYKSIILQNLFLPPKLSTF